MNPQAELESLLAEQFDGLPDEARNQKLRDLLHAHPELQERYVAFMQLHALLQWRGGAAKPEKATPARWRPARGLTAAALVLMAASVAAFFLFLAPAPTHADVVESLIDWNLDIAKAPPFEERGRIYSEKVASLKITMAKTDLKPTERELADSILETSTWLTKNDEPVAKAERFDEIADKIVERLATLTESRDETRVVKLADAYRRMAEQAVEPSFVQAVGVAKLGAGDKKKLEQVVKHDELRARKLEQIIERNPHPSGKWIRRGIKGRYLPRLRKHMKSIR
ncbi:MAG: hypothetical protein HYX68_00860 [Planctomycetes bacterium]|nr:hypothetical protein [Planctomycetota bacterium]